MDVHYSRHPVRRLDIFDGSVNYKNLWRASAADSCMHAVSRFLSSYR